MLQSAEDDKARQKLMAELYAPPKGARARARQGPGAQGGGMTGAQAQRLMAQMAAQDAQFAQRAGG